MRAIREFYKRERDGTVGRLDDGEIVSSLVVSNVSSGIRLGAGNGSNSSDTPTLGDVWDPVNLNGKWSAPPSWDSGVGVEVVEALKAQGGRRGGNADAWAAEEEVRVFVCFLCVCAREL